MTGVALPEPGAVLGTYRIESVLGEGSMARIYRAVHEKLGRAVAVKMLLPEAAANSRIRNRFFGEARALNRIHHDHLVAVTDFVEQGDLQFYVMELLEGQTLDGLMRGGVMPLTRSVGIWLQLADVLAALHEDHVVHRDLKPENVFISSRSTMRDFVKLMDFGVARILDREGSVILPADPGSVVGTPVYMAPEQTAGDDVDDLADIYSFGVLMYEMTTARLPLISDDLGELLKLKRTVTPIPPSQQEILGEPIPDDLDQLIMQCLSIDPAARPQSMQEVRLRLASMPIAGDVIDAPPMTALPPPGSTAPERRRRRAKQTNIALILGGTAVASLLGGYFVTVFVAEPEPRRLSLARGEGIPPELQAKQLSLSSTPPGARVFLKDDLLGRTPMVWTTSVAALPKTLRLELDGYRPAKLSVEADAGDELTVALQKVAKKPRKKKRRTKRRGERFMDPFQ